MSSLIFGCEDGGGNPLGRCYPLVVKFF